MKPLKDLFMHELLSAGSSPEPPTPPVPTANAISGAFTAVEYASKLVFDLQIPLGKYPKALLVFPTDGLIPGSVLYNAVARDAIVAQGIFKTYQDLSPLYAGENNDKGVILSLTKATASTDYQSNFYRDQYIFNNFGTNYTINGAVRFKSPNKVEFAIRGSGSSSGGFLKDVSYTYVVYY